MKSHLQKYRAEKHKKPNFASSSKPAYADQKTSRKKMHLSEEAKLKRLAKITEIPEWKQNEGIMESHPKNPQSAVQPNAAKCTAEEYFAEISKFRCSLQDMKIFEVQLSLNYCFELPPFQEHNLS